MDIAALLVTAEFLRIHEEQGPEAAQKWAAEQEAKLVAPESSDKKPRLRIVDS